MSITSFSKPSDAEILRKLISNNQDISFVGKGLILQKKDETRYIRTVKIKSDKEELTQNVIFIKDGIKWLFKTIENKEIVSTTYIKEHINETVYY